MTHSEQIIACARGWVGTRFHHQGRLKKTAVHAGGVDCLGLLVGVARELGLRGKGGVELAVLDCADYGHLPDGEALLAGLIKNLELVTPHSLRGLHEFREMPQQVRHDMIQPGDILLIAPEGTPRHLAIATESGIIHAYAQARKVVEHMLDAWWRERVVAVFRVR